MKSNVRLVGQTAAIEDLVEVIKEFVGNAVIQGKGTVICTSFYSGASTEAIKNDVQKELPEGWYCCSVIKRKGLHEEKGDIADVIVAQESHSANAEQPEKIA